MASLEEAITRKVPSGPANIGPGGTDIEHVHAGVGQPGEQFGHVEVRYQSVGQVHQRPHEQRSPWPCSSRHLPVTSSLGLLEGEAEDSVGPPH